MAGRLRVLAAADLRAILRLTDDDPVANLFLRSRITQLGVSKMTLGCEVLGLERRGQLTAVCHNGSNLVIAGADPEAPDIFAEKLGMRRHTSSIMGQAHHVRTMWEALSQRWGSSWAMVRQIRSVQPLMIMDTDPTGDCDQRVQPITFDNFASYFEAAVAMYTEEVGVSPMEPSGGYVTYVRSLVNNGRAFGIVEDGQVIFKADLGTVMDDACQVQGVWLHPDYRGRGLSVAAMNQVVKWARQTYPTVSLYVNDYNLRALKVYERVGFRRIGDFATVLY